MILSFFRFRFLFFFLVFIILYIRSRGMFSVSRILFSFVSSCSFPISAFFREFFFPCLLHFPIFRNDRRCGRPIDLFRELDSLRIRFLSLIWNTLRNDPVPFSRFWFFFLGTFRVYLSIYIHTRIKRRRIILHFSSIVSLRFIFFIDFSDLSQNLIFPCDFLKLCIVEYSLQQS